MTESIQNAKERCTDLTDHALVDPGSASPRMRCIGGRASVSTWWQFQFPRASVNRAQTWCHDLDIFCFHVAFILFFSNLGEMSSIHPPLHIFASIYMYFTLDREHPKWSLLRRYMSMPQPQETRNAHLLVPGGRAGCLHHLALPLLFRRRELVSSPPLPFIMVRFTKV